MSRSNTAARYVAWLERQFWWVIVIAVIAAAGSIALARYRLPLFADFSYLLPQDAVAVRDLRKLEARTTARDTARVVIVARDAAERVEVTRALVAGFRAISPDLVQDVLDDDADVRGYFSRHRYLFVPLADLEYARDALRRTMATAKAKANPMFIDLDDGPDPAEAEDRRRMDALRARRDEAEAKLATSGYVSADGKVGLVAVRTTFVKTDVGSGKRLLAAMSEVRARVLAAHPHVRIGLTGGIFLGVAEHDALLRGMLRSSLITALLVAGVLILFFRSARMLAMVTVTLLVGTISAFGAAALTVGHLNAATAFLGAIIAGNGVNYGVFLIARYLEACREVGAGPEALAIAVAGTLRPTLVASLAAAIAYGSLAATSFRGFADFALIGAVGMALCWIASYTLLPALVVRWGGVVATNRGAPLLGRVLVAVFGFRRPLSVVVIAGALTVGAIVIVHRYVADDPFEYDVKNLRSEGRDAVEGRDWITFSDATFGRTIASKTYIAADRVDQVPQIVAALRAVDAHLPEAKRAIGTVQSVLDVIPPDQDKKLAVLAELRGLLDDPLIEELGDQARADARALRPPDDLRPLTTADLPRALAETLAERDGSIGRLIAVRPSLTIDEWNGRDLIRFASAVRRLELPNGETVTTSGSNVIFADIITTIRGDGLKVTLIAAAGLLVMVLLVVGRNRRALAVLAATVLGALALVATSALLGLKVTFLDFVALPITLGLGIDYAINVADRDPDPDDPLSPLRTSGAAVFVCSLTTMIGYGSLLVSENLAIRGFGEASLIGEVVCVATALGLVPALLALGRRPR